MGIMVGNQNISNFSPYYQFDPQTIAQKGYVGFVGYQNSPYVQGTQANTANVAMGVPTVQQPAPIREAVPVYSAPQTAVNPTANIAGVVNPSITNINGTPYTAVGQNGAMVATDGSFKGINANGQSTWLGGTGYDWTGLGLNTAFGLFNAYQGYQMNKLAKAQFEDQRKLNHANYRMQAKAFNNNLRNQQSGRGYIGMNGSAKRALGAEYQSRKADDDY